MSIVRIPLPFPLMAAFSLLLLSPLLACDSSSEGFAPPDDDGKQLRSASRAASVDPVVQTNDTDTSPPQAVSELQLASLPTGHGILVTWQNPDDSDLAGVELLVSGDEDVESPDPMVLHFDQALSTQAMIEDLEPERAYVVSVTAFDLADNRSMPQQSQIVTKDTAPPEPLASFGAERLEPRLAQINWPNLPLDVASLHIRYSTETPVTQLDQGEGFLIDSPLPDAVDIAVSALDTLWVTLFAVDAYGNVAEQGTTQMVAPLTDDENGSGLVVLFEESFESTEAALPPALEAVNLSSVGDRQSAFFDLHGIAKPTWGILEGEGANGSDGFAHCAGSALKALPETRSEPGYAQNSQSSLSLTLDLSDVRSPLLTFYVRGQTAADWWDDTPYDWLELSVNGKPMGADGQPLRFGGEKATADWTFHSLSLDEFANQAEVTISFVFESGLNDNFYSGMMLDEIVVLGQPD